MLNVFIYGNRLSDKPNDIVVDLPHIAHEQRAKSLRLTVTVCMSVFMYELLLYSAPS